MMPGDPNLWQEGTAKGDYMVRLWAVPIVVALVFLMYSMVVLNWGHDRGEWTEAAAMVFVAAAIGARILVPRRRRGLISRLLQRQD